MTRATASALLLAALASLAAHPARAGLPVAPPPREVRPDGSRAPAPRPEKPEDPAAVVDRIIKNSKDVGDKLARTDTGVGTRKTQGKILSDIDALINRQENPPPPPKSGDNKDQDKNKDQSKDNNDQQDQSKDSNPMSKGMGNDPMNKNGPPKGGETPKEDVPKGDMGKGSKQDGMPSGGMNDPHPTGGQGDKTGRRPRAGGHEQKKPSEQPQGKPDPKQEKKVGPSKAAGAGKKPGGAAGSKPGGKMNGIASLPFSEDVAKDVWGHLPDRLRRQMTQYYKEDAMPKYSELLRLYFSSLSDKSPGSAMPRK